MGIAIYKCYEKQNFTCLTIKEKLRIKNVPKHINYEVYLALLRMSFSWMNSTKLL